MVAIVQVSLSLRLGDSTKVTVAGGISGKEICSEEDIQDSSLIIVSMIINS